MKKAIQKLRAYLSVGALDDAERFFEGLVCNADNQAAFRISYCQFLEGTKYRNLAAHTLYKGLLPADRLQKPPGTPEWLTLAEYWTKKYGVDDWDLFELMDLFRTGPSGCLEFEVSREQTVRVSKDLQARYQHVLDQWGSLRSLAADRGQTRLLNLLAIAEKSGQLDYTIVQAIYAMPDSKEESKKFAKGPQRDRLLPRLRQHTKDKLFGGIDVRNLNKIRDDDYYMGGNLG